MKTIRFTAYPDTPKKGDRFGRLLVIDRVKIGGDWHLKCRCDCGAETTVQQRNAKSGRSKSCGCLQREVTAQANRKHGDAGRAVPQAPEYRIWQTLIQRCTNPKNKKYPRYGGRGIRVSEVWLLSYESFLADVGRRPSPAHSIERKNNDGHYEVGNVKWAPRIEQANNTSLNRLIEHNGKRQTMAEWAREIGINYSTLRNRLNAGLSPEVAFQQQKTV